MLCLWPQGHRWKAILAAMIIAPEPMQAPTTVLGSSFMAVSSASKYLIRPAEDMRPLPSDFFLDIILPYLNTTFKYVSVVGIARAIRAFMC